MEVCGQHHALATLPQERDLVCIVHEAGWAPGLAWVDVENFAPSGIQSPDHPACSELLH
jgi:hypothetical protein